MTQSWESFGVVVGGASGALTGLLFVAVSLNINRIAARPALRVSAAQTLVLFVLPLVAAILLVVPRQADWALGTELVVLGLLAGAVLAVIGRGRKASTKPESTLERVLDRTTPKLATSLFLEIAGVTTIVGEGGGLYWLVPAAVLALVGGVENAWLLLVRVPE